MNKEKAEKFLISRGHNPTSHPSGTRNFHRAITEGKLNIVKAWLAYGMTLYTEYESLAPIIRAIQEKKPKIVRLFIDQGIDLAFGYDNNETALHYALRVDRPKAIQVLIDGNSPLDISDHLGRTPLICALENNPNYVKVLLQAGADPNYGSLFGATPLGIAATEALSKVDLLIKHGADANAMVKGQTVLTEKIISEESDTKALRKLIKVGADPNLANAFGWTPMMVCQVRDAEKMRKVLLSAGVPDEEPNAMVNLFEFENEWDSNFEKTKQALDGFDVDVKSEIGQTALIWVTHSGSPQTVRYLLEKGADLNYNIDGSSPLSSAALGANHEVVALLLEHGAKPNNLDGQSSALMQACYKGEVESVRLLIEAGANPDSKDALKSALSQAIYHAPVEVVKLLLDAGAKTADTFDIIGLSPLTYAISLGRPEIVREIIASGANVNLQDKNGKTALYFAVERGFDYDSNLRDCIQILLEGGADSKLTSDRTPYAVAKTLYAGISGQIATFETTTQFEKFGSDDIAAFAQTVDAYRLDLWIEKDLDFAKQLILNGAGKDEMAGVSPIASALTLEDNTLFELLIDQGYSPNGENMDGESPLQVACQLGQIDKVQILLKAKADIGYVNPDRNTDALSNAVDSKNLDIVKCLLEHGMDANRQKSGWTPLCHAISINSLEMVELLLKAGASTKIKTHTNRTVEAVARDTGWQKMIELVQ